MEFFNSRPIREIRGKIYFGISRLPCHEIRELGTDAGLDFGRKNG